MKIFSHWFIFVLVLILDQFTKYLAYTRLELGRSIEIIPGFLCITLVNNPGAAFGIFADLPDSTRRFALLLVSIVAIWIIIRFLLRDAKNDLWAECALIGILSGAIGNIIDRLRFDYVVDFIDVIYWNGNRWPAFNIADSAISIGVTILLIRMLFFGKQSPGQDSKVSDLEAVQ